ncbi:4105_t:CDS:10 [Ambispora leptoticha]|uniref:4105_t:CDS:1 n=1 Tax=Ambispora leptoticha TaxID=144679 RepID=A0A9N8Z7F1_9GLOM|nr:4105_t:CDS:10 [Ambispora leptoticha]
MAEIRQADPVRQLIIKSLFSDSVEDPRSPGQSSESEKLVSYLKVNEETWGGQSPTGFDRPASILRRGNRADKTRYLLLSVNNRKGRVRLHKAKKNGNTHFQIGKTWPLENIVSVEVIDPQTFLMTMNKTYCWSAEKQREKNEFLASIYQKHINRLPQLINVGDNILREIQPRSTLNGDTDSYELAASLQSRLENKSQPTFPRTVDQSLLNLVQNDRSTPSLSRGGGSETPIIGNYADDEDYAKQEEISLINVEELLNDFNWKETGNAAALEERLLNELAALEAANIHAMVESDDRLNAVIRQLDKAIAELDHMDQWLTLYTAELNSMGEDIHHIESQNRGLQVQTANQKALLAELDRLIQSITIPDEVFLILRQENLDTVQGVQRIEEAAARLQAALESTFDEATREMVAVKEKVELYSLHSNGFSNRLYDHLKKSFQYQADILMNDKSRGPRRNSLTVLGHETIEDCLLKYRGLSLWMKEIDPRRHNELQSLYVQEVAPIYQKESKEYMVQMRSMLSKRELVEEASYVFSAASHIQSHRSGLASGSSGDFSRAPWEYKDAGGGKLPPEEGFDQIMLTIIPLIVREQNFISDFFHLGNKGPKTFLNREELMNWNSQELNAKQELANFIDFGCKHDNIQSVGMLVVLDKYIYEYQKTSQEFLVKLLGAVKLRCIKIFEKFTNEQLRAIEDTKVTIKKRKGIILFIKLFPRYCERIEHSMEGELVDKLEVREIVNKSYERIVKTMFDSLEAIAKDTGSLADDKEQLNVHTMMLENMHHFYTEILTHKISVLEPYVKHAKTSYEKHLEAYSKSVLRKPFGKLIEFFDGIAKLEKTTAAPEEVGFHLRYSKDALKKVISQFPGKEIKKGLESSYRRVDRHFTQEEGLLQVVWLSIQTTLLDYHKQFTARINKCYPDTNISLEFTTEDLTNYFSELARNH